MIATCFEHLERAIDEFVVHQEQAPDIYLAEKSSDKGWDIPCSCHYCSQKPQYLVTERQMG